MKVPLLSLNTYIYSLMN